MAGPASLRRREALSKLRPGDDVVAGVAKPVERYPVVLVLREVAFDGLLHEIALRPIRGGRELLESARIFIGQPNRDENRHHSPPYDILIRTPPSPPPARPKATT